MRLVATMTIVVAAAACGGGSGGSGGGGGVVLCPYAVQRPDAWAWLGVILCLVEHWRG